MTTPNGMVQTQRTMATDDPRDEEDWEDIVEEYEGDDSDVELDDEDDDTDVFDDDDEDQWNR